MFWLGGSLTNNLHETSFLAAVINAIGSVGSTFGFVVSAMNVDYNWACAINLILFFISIPPTAWVVFTKVSDTSHGESLTGGEESPRASSFETSVPSPALDLVGEKKVT